MSPPLARALLKVFFMLSTELSTILSGLALFFGIFATIMTVKCWNFCRDTEEFVKKWALQKGPSVSAITRIETDLTEHKDSIEALHVSLRKLRARIGMREHRATGSPTEGQIPDSGTDPAGYKRAMRLKLRGSVLK